MSIYKDSLDAKWDPYEDFLRRQLTRVDDVILVPAGGSATVVLPATGVLYPGTAQEKTIALTFTFDTLSSTYLSLKGNVLTSAVPPAYDSYVDLRLKISCANTGFTYAKRISAVAQADFSVLVEYLDADGKTQTANLYDKVKDKTVIETLLQAYRDYKDGNKPKPTGPNGEWLISRAVVNKVTSLTFDGQSNTELMGLELFFSSNLSSLTLKNYHAVTKADGSRADFSFTRDAAFWTKLKSLRSLTFNTGVVDLFDFSVPSLTSLQVVNCLYLVMDRTKGGVTESAFAGLSTLKTLDLAYNNIGNFWAVGEVPQVTTLFLYGNPGSKLVQTENYVKLAYQSAKRHDPFGAFNYRVTDKDIVWLPDSQEIWIDPVVVTDSGAERALAEGSASCNVVAPNAELRLPSVYRHEQIVQGDTTDAVGTAEAKLTWTSSAPSLVEIAGTADADGRFGVRVLGAAQAYVLLTATVDGSEKTLTYALFLDGSEDPFWSAFLVGGVSGTALADPTFAYCVYTDLHPVDGVVTEAAAAALTSFVHPDDIIADIRGIRKLTGLTALDLSENEIVDASELFVLERLTSLKLAGNRIASLWLPASSSLAQGLETTVRVNAEGAEDAAGAYSLTVANFSLFYRMSGLTNLFVQRNPTIADYGPISFRDDRSAQTVGSPAVKVQAAAREGLANLSELAMFPFELKNNHYNDPGDAKDIGNLKAVYPHNYFVLWYDTCISAGKKPAKYWKYETQTDNVDSVYKGCQALEKIEESFYGTAAYDGSIIRIKPTGSTLPAKIDGLTMHYFYPDPTQSTGISKEFNVDANTGAVRLTGSVAKLNHTVYLVVMVQDSQYRLVPVDITIDSAQTYWVQDADGTERSAEEVFPDEVLRSALFFKFDVKADAEQKMTLTPAVVAAYKTNKLDLSYYGIRDLTGLDYILQTSTAINEIALGYNAITALPALDVPAGRSYKLDLSNCKVLEDLTGLERSAGGAGMVSLGASLHALDVTNCKSLPEAEVNRISAANCPGLLTLTVSGLHLTDYSFLTRLPVGMAEVNMSYSDGVPPQLLKGHNLDAVKQLFLRTSPANGQGLDAADFQYFGVANAPIFGEYLHFPVSYDAAQPVWLPLQVTLYGMEYAIDWTGLPEKGSLRTDLVIAGVTFADGIGTYSKDGKSYLVFALADLDTAEWSGYAQLVDGEGRRTYREKIVLNFSADVIPRGRIVDRRGRSEERKRRLRAPQFLRARPHPALLYPAVLPQDQAPQGRKDQLHRLSRADLAGDRRVRGQQSQLFLGQEIRHRQLPRGAGRLRRGHLADAGLCQHRRFLGGRPDDGFALALLPYLPADCGLPLHGEFGQSGESRALSDALHPPRLSLGAAQVDRLDRRQQRLGRAGGQRARAQRHRLSAGLCKP